MGHVCFVLFIVCLHICECECMMIMRQYFPRLWYDPYPLYARGLGLCLFFSALVCDLLPRRLIVGIG